MNDRIMIEVASAEDALVVAEIGRLTFYETWRPVNSEEDMQLYMKKAFDIEKIKSDLANTTVNLFLLASDDEQPVGYAKMRRDRVYNEFNGQKAIEIERIYVKNAYHGKSVGKLLMDHCIQRAKAENNVWLWLAVNNENYKAMRFYEKYDFEIFGTKKFILGNAEDEDLLLKLKIGSGYLQIPAT